MRSKLFVPLLVVLMLLPAAHAQETPKKPPAPAKEEKEWVTNDEKGVQVLSRYLKEDKSKLVLLASLDTLARLGEKARPAVPEIFKLLKHPEWEIRLEAARTLIDVEVETKAAVQTLEDALRARDSKVRSHAADLIGQIANPPIDLSVGCWGPGPRPATPRPAIGKQAVPLLVNVLKDEAEEVRCRAASSLGRIGADARKAMPNLLDALEDKSPTVRKAAAEAAQRIVVDAAAKAGVKEFEKAQAEYLFK